MENTTLMKRANELIQENYPHIFWTYATDSIDLMKKDINNLQAMKKMV